MRRHIATRLTPAKADKKNRPASFQATRLSHKDPWLSAPASRRVWLFQEIKKHKLKIKSI
jgi:hypothetical protein